MILVIFCNRTNEVSNSDGFQLYQYKSTLEQTPHVVCSLVNAAQKPLYNVVNRFIQSKNMMRFYEKSIGGPTVSEFPGIEGPYQCHERGT